MEKMHPSFGKATKGKAGSRTVDHPNMGASMGGKNNKEMKMTSPMGGKCQKTMGGGERGKCKDPGVKCYAQGPQGKQSGGY